jgi:hypothetical protein
LKDVFDQPETMWMQFRRRLDCLQPYCRVVSHTEGEVRDILIALEQIYRPSFPALNLQQWTGSIHTWLTHPLLDPQKSGRVLMDPLMKLVTTALKWSYAQAEADVTSQHLKAAAELLTLRRDKIQIIDAENNRFKEEEQEKQESAEEQKKPKPKAGKQKSWKNSPLPTNRRTHLRNESEFSSKRFLGEYSDKGVSGQYLRPNIHPIYHFRKGLAGACRLVAEEAAHLDEQSNGASQAGQISQHTRVPTVDATEGLTTLRTRHFRES